MHKTQPNQEVRIITVELAVPNQADRHEIFDSIHSLLEEYGVGSEENDLILDWRYTGEDYLVTATSDPEEGEVFYLTRTKEDYYRE